MLNGDPVAWKSKMRPIVALSTADAEFVAANYAACEIMFLRQFMEVMGFGQDKPTCLFVDNSAAVYQSRRRPHEGSQSDEVPAIRVQNHYVLQPSGT